MGHQSPHYLKLKGKTYYFSRRVPKELQKHSKCSRFEVCLRTSIKSVAFKQAMLLAQELDDQWSILRRRERNDRVARFFGSEVVSSSALNSEVGRGPKLTEGLDVHLFITRSPLSKRSSYPAINIKRMAIYKCRRG